MFKPCIFLSYLSFNRDLVFCQSFVFICVSERRTGDGKAEWEFMRCLKRYIAREIFRLLSSMTLGHPVPRTGSAGVMVA